MKIPQIKFLKNLLKGSMLERKNSEKRFLLTIPVVAVMAMKKKMMKKTKNMRTVVITAAI